jgi:hypothetical protein
VSEAYTPPFPFSGTLRRVVVEIAADGVPDPARESRAALAEE